MKTMNHPLLTKEFLYSWFDGFKNFDVNKLENRKMLVDTFVNSVVLYDDRIDFYFNFKDKAKSLTLSELNTVSDLSSSSPPRRRKLHIACGDFFIASHSFRCSSFPKQVTLKSPVRLLSNLKNTLNRRDRAFPCPQQISYKIKFLGVCSHIFNSYIECIEIILRHFL